MTAFEYRVSWTRLGRRRRSVILQTEQAARAKAERLVAIDEAIRDDDVELLDSWGLGHLLPRYSADPNVPESNGLPTLMAPPLIERRNVGDWTRA